jgi:hypothetical protein
MDAGHPQPVFSPGGKKDLPTPDRHFVEAGVALSYAGSAVAMQRPTR